MIVTSAALHGGKKLVDIVCRNGLITAITPAGQAPREPGEEVIDAEGRLAIPGLWDEHVHIGQWASHRRRIDVSSATSPVEALTIVRDAPLTDDDVYRVGAGMRSATWFNPPTLEMIDSWSGDTPWVIFAIDIHSCWVNTAALRHFGFESTASGLLTEHDSFALLHAIDSVDSPTPNKGVAEAESLAASRGVVGIVDLDMGPTIDNWIRRRSGVQDYVVKVMASVYPETLDLAIDRGISSGDVLAPGVWMGPLKAITDGSLNTRTAYVTAPYQGGDAHATGNLNYSLDDIDRFVTLAHSAGLEVTLHAIGDRANTLMLDVFERHGIPGRIEHAQLVSAEDIPRFSRLGVTASIQPQHAVDDREVTDVLWADRVDQAFPAKSLLAAGAEVVFGSDAPVSALDPWVQIAAAVTRTDDDREPWHPEQAITVSEAIACSTRSTIQTGQPADLVLLDADPYWLETALAPRRSALSEALRTLPVWLTLVEGRVTHRGGVGGDDGNRTRTISLED